MSALVLSLRVLQNFIHDDQSVMTDFNFMSEAKEADAFIIRPGFDEHSPRWLDVDGERIEAHGAGMLQSPIDNRWYWYGESAKVPYGEPSVTCYSADTLAGPWTNEGKMLTSDQIEIEGLEQPFILERPKVIFNRKTQKFVMWVHVDHLYDHLYESMVMLNMDPSLASTSKTYILRHVGVATSESANGPYKLEHLLQPDGFGSLDFSLWADNDGTAYFIRSCDNNFTAISLLSDDYLNTTGILSTGPLFEGMALFRHTNGTLYMFTSHLTGWNPNPLMLFRSDGPSLKDPQWVNVGNPTGDVTSFNTQPTYVVPHTTQSGMTYHIYMGDNWINAGSQGLTDASYVWLPINFLDDGSVRLDRLEEWDLENPFGVLNTRDYRVEYDAERGAEKNGGSSGNTNMKVP